MSATMTTNRDLQSNAGDGAARQHPQLANAHAQKWIDNCIELCKPDKVYYCNGSPEERKALYAQGVKEGILVELNQQKLPGSYYHRSNPNDVARSEHLT